jgi:hypothetical protein
LVVYFSNKIPRLCILQRVEVLAHSSGSPTSAGLWGGPHDDDITMAGMLVEEVIVRQKVRDRGEEWVLLYIITCPFENSLWETSINSL